MLEDDGFKDVSPILHCAVYALVKKGEVVYVGKSKKPLRRLMEHKGQPVRGIAQAPRISFDSVWVLGCMLGQLDTLEQFYIKKYRPRYNVLHNPDKKGQIVIPPDIQALLATLAPELPSSKDSFQRAPGGPYMIRRL